MVNNCVFVKNTVVATAAGEQGAGGAIYLVTASGGEDELKVVDSIFKNNKALSVGGTSSISGGGAIYAINNDGQQDVLVLSSVFELNEASSIGGAARIAVSSVAWYNNKELLFGNDAGEDCDGANVEDEDCFSVEDNFSV